MSGNVVILVSCMGVFLGVLDVLVGIVIISGLCMIGRYDSLVV